MPDLKRHDFVHLGHHWQSGLHSQLNEDECRTVTEWQAANRPFVVAASGVSDPAGTVRLGRAGPGKTRLGLVVATQTITHHNRPPLLAEIAPALPSIWQATLSALTDWGAAHGARLRIYGSAAMQVVTGLTYLTERSDIDLLIEGLAPRHLTCALSGLAGLQPPPRLDGEIRLVGLGDIAWREWLQSSEQILVRTPNGPRLLPRSELTGR